eukprot:m51a1_g48 putative nucleoporin seh1 (314) ;mRNA; r:166147-167436
MDAAGMMGCFASFATEHADIVHDVAADYYGERLATCSADGQIKVWDRHAPGPWHCTSSWAAHKGPVNKLAWAHPEFGQVLASCSADHKVCIWNETEDENGRPKWVLRADLVDARENVNDIEFAPPHIGLKLAACSVAGVVVLYEATDLMSLSNWQVLRDFDAFPRTGGCNCLSWNPSPFDKPMIAVGSNDTTVKIFEWVDHQRKWDHVCSLTGNSGAVLDVAWAPNVGRSYHLLATASKDGFVMVWQLLISERGKHDATPIAKFEHHQAEVWRVEWNVTGTVLASSGDDGTVRLWKANAQNSWGPLCVIQGTE